jgi:NAD(P)H dehydrogenase (quinone)
MHKGSTMTRPLNHALIVAHPSEDSFTMAVARRFLAAVEGHGQAGFIRDLYRVGFDPLLKEDERHGEIMPDVEAELALLAEADVIVLVYPIWFGAPPAMLKGYVDRVFGAGRAVGQAQDGAAGSRLAGKQLVSLQLSGSMRAWLHEQGVLMSLRNLFERYLCEVFGLPESHSYHFDGITPDMGDKDAAFHFAKVDDAARAVLAHVRREWQKEPPRG